MPTLARLLPLLLMVTLLASPAAAQLVPGLGVGGGSSGSTTQSANTPGPVPAPAPTAIPAERIPAQVEQARDLARRASEAARATSELEALRQQVEALDGLVTGISERFPEELLARFDMRSLEAALENVMALRRTVTAAQQALAPRVDELAGWRDSVSFALARWELTETEQRSAQATPELVGTVTSTKATLREAAQRLDERRDEILALTSVLAERLATIDERRVLLEGELSRARIELFRPEHPPIWRGESEMFSIEASRAVWMSDYEALRNYLVVRPGNNGAFIAVLVFLLGAFTLLSRQVTRWVTDKPSLAQPLAVFRHPLAAALVLSILASPWLYPDAPGVLRDLWGVLLVLPLVIMLPTVVTPSLRGALYLTAGLYIMMRLNVLLGAGTSLERYWLLTLAAVAAATIAWIFRPGGAGARLEAGRWWAAARLAAQLGLIVLVVALLANIGGFVSLSGLLTNAVVSSAFIAIVLFAGLVVTRAMLIAFGQTPALQRLNMVRWHAAAVDQWMLRILPLVALLAWLLATARQFRIDDLLANMVRSVLFTSASIGTVQISLGEVLAFGLAIWLGLLVSRFLRFVLTVDVYPRVTLPRGAAATISMLVNYVIIGIAFVLAVAAAGIQLDRFALIVGALTVGIGFGLQNIVNNFVSGLILAFERPVQSGDTIEFSNMFGKVSRIGVRSSTVRTFDGAEVIVPNANLISNEVTNWTLSDMRRRMEILVGVAYGSNPHKVLELLRNVAAGEERLLQNPAPSVLFLGFGDSSLDFSLRAWTDDFDNFLSIKSDLTLAVHDALYAHEIEIPFPQRDLHLRSIDPQAVARIGAVNSPPVGDDDQETRPGERPQGEASGSTRES